MNFIQGNCKEILFHTSLTDVARWLDINLTDYDWNISNIDGAWPELNDMIRHGFLVWHCLIS